MVDIHRGESQDKTRDLLFYQNLYSEDEEWRSTSNCEELSRLSEEDKLSLERAFEEEEVQTVLLSCATDKGSI